MAQRHVKLLKKAKCYLNDELFICFAIERAVGYKEDHCTEREIRQYIMRAIYPHATLGSWLHGNYYSDRVPSASADHMIDYRKRWIQHMIQNHEEFFGKD